MRLEFEWHEAPGVRDDVLKATWARLQIHVSDQIASEALDLRSSSRRTGIYGPLFPLAEWLVEQWWHLLHEPAITSTVMGGRAAAPWMRDWVQRHNLLAARDGGALPDLTMVRDGDEIAIQWEPDPVTEPTQRLRFIGQGQQRIGLESFRDGLAGLVDAVIARLDHCELLDADSQGLRESWAAVQDSAHEEPELCQALATLGLDPYDSDESTGEIIETIGRMGELGELDVLLRDDLLQGTRVEGTNVPDLTSDLDWTLGTRRCFAGPDAAKVQAITLPLVWEPTAHDTGYRLARATRTELLGDHGHGVIDDLQELLVSRLGWAESVETTVPSAQQTRLDALVGLDADHGCPILVVPSPKETISARFRLARAAFYSVSGVLGGGPRLITRAYTRHQRASRAFAAELLCPADALAAELSGSISNEQVEAIARKFNVSSWLVTHQLENHGMGPVEAP